MTKKTLQELDSDLDRLRSEVAALDRRIEQSVHVAALEQRKEMSDGLDQRIDTRFRTAFVLGGLVLALMGGLGFLGIKSLVPGIVRESIDASTANEIRRVKRQIDGDVLAIQSARQATASSPLIVLQTDYGDDNYYMGRLKGVIYSVNPHARIETITAGIAEFDRLNAAWTLWRASRYYPSGTIFVVITNPGGITSTMTVLTTQHGQVFVGHDNGCFDLVVQDYGLRKSYTIASPELSPKEYREMFGGVDLFGPTAAQLSLGFPLDKVGPASTDYRPKLPMVPHEVRPDRLSLPPICWTPQGRGMIPRGGVHDEAERPSHLQSRVQD